MKYKYSPCEAAGDVIWIEDYFLSTGLITLKFYDGEDRDYCCDLELKLNDTQYCRHIHHCNIKDQV